MALGVAETNARWAAAIIGGLAGAGVTRVVVSPGSRSTPLAVAALRNPAVKVDVVLDERAAAFFALGLAKALGQPAALICTSGSAVANWHPAAIEADAGTVPLILLSSDRPPELLDCGANQAIDQARLFGQSLRAFHALPPADDRSGWLANLMAQSVLESRWPLAGPVQINVPFREPLLAEGTEGFDAPAGSGPVPTLPVACPGEDDLAGLAAALSGRRVAIVCGTKAMPASSLARLAERLGAPILADPLSGLRFGGHDRSRVVAAYDLFLAPGRLVPDVVLRFGPPPVSKPLGQWAGFAPVEEWVVLDQPRWSDPTRRATRMIAGDIGAVADGLARHARVPADPSWFSAFARAEALAQDAVAASGVAEASVVAALLDALGEESLLFLGNSTVIRDVDAYSGTRATAIAAIGNRGASGIDGNLSTFLGAASSGRYRRAAALVGDLTFLHDASGLAAWRGDVTLCVLANGGGTIFDRLPQARLLPKEEYEQGWLTPQDTDVALAALAHGYDHERVGANGFAAALGRCLGSPGRHLIEIAVERGLGQDRRRALTGAMAQSLETPT